MSGGRFDYDQYKIENIIEGIQHEILYNNEKSDPKNEWEEPNNYSEKTIIEFKKAIGYLRAAKIYAQRIDWLLSGDDGEETFHIRLKQDLDKEFNN